MLVPERVDVVAVVALRLRDAVRCDACAPCVATRAMRAQALVILL